MSNQITKVVFSIDKASVKPFVVKCDKAEQHCPAVSYMNLNGISFDIKDKSTTRNVVISPFQKSQMNAMFLYTLRNMCDCCKQK